MQRLFKKWVLVLLLQKTSFTILLLLFLKMSRVIVYFEEDAQFWWVEFSYLDSYSITSVEHLSSFALTMIGTFWNSFDSLSLSFRTRYHLQEIVVPNTRPRFPPLFLLVVPIPPIHAGIRKGAKSSSHPLPLLFASWLPRPSLTKRLDSIDTTPRTRRDLFDNQRKVSQSYSFSRSRKSSPLTFSSSFYFRLANSMPAWSQPSTKIKFLVFQKVLMTSW